MMKKVFERDHIYIYPIYVMDIVSTRDIAVLDLDPVKRTFCSIKQGRFCMVYDDSYKSICHTLFDRVLNDKNYSNLVINKINDYSRQLLDFCKSVKSIDPSNKTNQELIDIYLKYIKLLKAMRVWGWIPVFVDGLDKPYITDHVMQGLQKQLQTLNQADRLTEIYTILSTADKPSEIQQEEISRLKMLIDISALKESATVLRAIKDMQIVALEQYPDAMELFEDHRKRYEWLTYAYVGPVMSLEHLLSICKDTLERGDLYEQYQKLLNKYEELSRQKQDLYESLNLSDELIRLFKISCDFMHLKDFRKGVYQKSYVVMDKILAEIAHRLQFSLDEVKYLVFEEVKDALLNNKSVYYSALVKERMQECCYVVENGEIKIYSGAECESMVKKYLPADESEQSTKELKGMTAYPGVVKGKVKVILVAEDVSKMQEGDILVSNATNPDLILAMKKSSAIVTDMGGITSHASIISRELQIPCVVGTKFATKILKDGDMVEVDANKGKVTKL